MSSEGKKKRGAAGLSNAKTQAFRGNGKPPDWMARNVGATHAPPAVSGGSVTMRGLLGGVIAEKLGLGKMVGDYDRMIAHAEKRVTHPYLLPANDNNNVESAAA